AVSIYNGDQVLIGNIERKLKSLKLKELLFFDSTSAACWNNPHRDIQNVEK
ncbi:MAG: hypothetical protein ACI9YE_003492, partial [Psychroserpens sp.]